MSASTSVWDRRNDRVTRGTMSRQLYMLLVCGWTAAGIAFSAIMSRVSQDWQLKTWSTWQFWGFFLAILAVSFIGTAIANASDSAAVSAFGYALVAGPFGLMLGPVMAMYKGSSVLKIFVLTSAVVLILGLIGALLPDDLASWGTPLMGGLMLLIGGYFIVPILGFFGLPVTGAMTALDWIGLIIFGALVIFDLNRAVRLPHTADNAVDSAVAIYLDFINIFIRLLSLMGEEK